MLTEEKLATKAIHAKNSKDIGRYGGCDGDQRFHEYIRFDFIGTLSFDTVRSIVDNIISDLTNGSTLIRMIAIVLVETIKQFGKPHHEAVITDVESEVDDY